MASSGAPPTSDAVLILPEGCPYAAALKRQQNDVPDTDCAESTTTTSSFGGDAEDAKEEWEALELARQKCPAFRPSTPVADGSSSSGPNHLPIDTAASSSSSLCPFSHARTSQEIKETLLQIPSSHLEPNGIFVKSLQRLHRVSGSFVIPGGCPVKNSTPPVVSSSAATTGLDQVDADSKQTLSFDQALEEFSLAAIMARMAREWEDDQQLEQQQTQESGTQAQQGNMSVSASSSDARNSKPSRLVPDDRTTSGSSKLPTTDKSRRDSTVSLSDALKTGTAVSHQQAETVHFVKNFIRGKIDRKLYAQLIANLYHVYAALEEVLDTHAPNYFAACHFPKELYRTKALQEDVEFWWPSSSHGNDDDFQPPPMSEATKDYVERIRACASENPMLLLAHAYTRYLGDLSGGKILARVARRALHLKPRQKGMDADDEGLAFYTFEHVPSAKLFKDTYRDCLNALELVGSSSSATNNVQQDEEHSRVISEIVLEANIAFGLNIRLFEELDVMGNVPGATIRPLSSVMHWEDEESKEGDEETTSVKESAKCPFASLSTTANASDSNHAMNPHAVLSFGGGSSKREGEMKPQKMEKATRGGQCPWPFIFCHDPITGIKCWQTWVLFGILISWWWNNNNFQQ